MKETDMWEDEKMFEPLAKLPKMSVERWGGNFATHKTKAAHSSMQIQIDTKMSET